MSASLESTDFPAKASHCLQHGVHSRLPRPKCALPLRAHGPNHRCTLLGVRASPFNGVWKVNECVSKLNKVFARPEMVRVPHAPRRAVLDYHRATGSLPHEARPRVDDTLGSGGIEKGTVDSSRNDWCTSFIRPTSRSTW